MPSTGLNNRLDNMVDPAECIHAILKDIACTYPQDQLDIMRDSNRVTQQSKSRGLGFFTLDLPAIGRKFDYSLSTGRLDLGELPHTRGYRRGTVIPRLFRGLWLRIFNLDGLLRADADPTAVFFMQCLLTAFKKADVMYSQKSLYEATKEFHDAEERLPPAPEIWDTDRDFENEDCGHLGDFISSSYGRDLFSRNSSGGRTGHLLRAVQQIADRLSRRFGEFFAEDVRGRHGPGAVSELPITKYKYDFGIWSPNLESRFPYAWFGLPDPAFEIETVERVGMEFREESSRLIPVPKTAKGPRLIAAEPISHQWIQQGIAHNLRKAVRHSPLSESIDFFDQRPSMLAALKASATGLDATVDLKSASDNLSCYLLQRVFRLNPSLLNLMRACRTRFMSNSIDSKQQTILKLRKFATMGSALTFPVQSIVFAAFSLGVGHYRNPRLSLRALCRKVRVFGDDIVVPKDWVPDLTAVLTAVGLEVSTTKTFTEGNFRESCGMYAFRGEDVTPPRLGCLKRFALEHDEVSSWLDVCNNFYLKGLWNTSDWMIRTVPQVSQFPVVPLRYGSPGHITFNNVKEVTLGRQEDDKDVTHLVEGGRKRAFYRRTAQIRTGSGRQLVKARWSPYLQRWEAKVRTLSKRSTATPLAVDSSSYLLEFYTRSLGRSETVSEWPSVNSRGSQERLRSASVLPPIGFIQSSLGRIADRRVRKDERLGVISSTKWVPLATLFARVEAVILLIPSDLRR